MDEPIKVAGECAAQGNAVEGAAAVDEYGAHAEASLELAERRGEVDLPFAGHGDLNADMPEIVQMFGRRAAVGQGDAIAPKGLLAPDVPRLDPAAAVGHNEKRAIKQPRGGRAIGWFPDNPLRRDEIRMQPGDICVYYTDGVSEASNKADQMYGEERLISAVQRNAHLPADQILLAVLKDVDAFCEGVDPFDDQTLVIVRFTG